VPLANKVEGEADTEEAFVERYNTAGGVVIGTPDDAIEYIEGLLEQSGGFGTFLLLGHDWASPERTMQSYRLIAEKVIPHFQGQLASPRASHEWATENRNKLFGRSIKAMGNAIQQHVDEKEKDAAEAGTLAGDGEVTA
jgi:limonene 1,2-monooxygenase